MATALIANAAGDTAEFEQELKGVAKILGGPCFEWCTNSASSGGRSSAIVSALTVKSAT